VWWRSYGSRSCCARPRAATIWLCRLDACGHSLARVSPESWRQRPRCQSPARPMSGHRCVRGACGLG
jgi:hypothetical protein